jgi:CHAT domain-containing protein/predicted negative regulator of RcsB-dependent stress response
VSTEVHFRDEVRKLEPEHPLEMELKGGQGDRYEVALQAGQYVHIVADQRGIDVTLRLRAPDGTTVLEVDSPTGNTGPEQIFTIPEVSGTFRVEVFSTEAKDPAGRYEVKLDTPRIAKDADRNQVRAFKSFAEGDFLIQQGSLDSKRQSLPKFEAALALWRELDNREWVAESLSRIGWAHQDLSEKDKALAALQEALPLLHALGKRVEEGKALTRCGTIQLHYGLTQEAIELQLKALTIFREIGKVGLESSTLNSLAAAYDVAGEAQKGLDAYRLALDRAKVAGGWQDEEASALRGIGDVLLNLGKLEPAMDSLRKALDAFRKQNNSRQAAYVLSRMAGISQRLGRLDDALSQLQEALEIQQRIDDKDGQMSTLNTLGTVQLLKKDIAKAGETYGRALKLAQSTKNRHGEAVSLLNLGRYRFEAGDPSEALRLHEQAAALFQAIHFRRGEVSTLYGSARALHALGDFTGARERLERVVEGVEALREESQSQDLRGAYFATKQNYLDLQVDVLMHLHALEPGADYDAQALALNERRRARSLLELLAVPRKEMEKSADPELLAQDRQIRQKINAIEVRLRTESATRQFAEIDAMEEGQRSRLLELADIDARLRSRNPEFSSSTLRPQPPNVLDMQKLVGDWGLLLVYSLGEERSFLWCLAKEGQLETYTLPSRAWVEEAARQVRTAWSHRGGERGAGARWAARLSREILGPVAQKLGKKRLLIVADGGLETLPFAALPDPRTLSANPEQEESAEPLVVQNEIIHLPSVSTLVALRNKLRRRAVPPAWLGIVADPVFSADDPRVKASAPAARPSDSPADLNLARATEDLGIQRFERLLFTRVEAESIAKLVPSSSRVALDFEASRELMESRELKRYRILHFATHGLLNSEHPELSGLVLSLVDPQGNPRENGFLLAQEISGLDLPAQLVVLSACQTGVGGEVRGEGLGGLTRSFMSAGVPRVIVSLWNVNDQATSELMTRFYRGMIAKGLPPSAALRCAQLSMRGQKEWSSPYFWAPFIFQGEWRTRNDSGGPPIGREAVPSQPPPVPDTDFPPPGSDGTPPCPELP